MMRNATPTVGPSNVLDNLGRRLLQWNFREEWKETHGGGSSATIPPNLILRDLPNTFISAQHYIDMWEPLVVREIQENVLSDVRNNLSSLFTQKCSLKARDDIETATLVHLDMTSSVDDESRPEFFPSALDIVFFGLEPNALKLTMPVQPTKTMNCIGLVAAIDYRGGRRICEVLMLHKDWRRICDLRENRHALDGNETVGTTFSKDSTTSTSSSSNSGDMYNKSKPVKPKIRPAIILHYTVLTNLRSSWREYQAVWNINQIRLKSAVLATPPGTVMKRRATAARSTNTASTTTANDSNVQISRNASSEVVDENETPSAPAAVEVALPGGLSGSFSPISPTTRQNVKHDFPFMMELELAQHWKASQKFMKHLKDSFNPSQLCAMHSAVTSDGFSLIQGPPGTGKTKTILGLLNGIHLREYNTYYEELLLLFLGPAGYPLLQKNSDAGWIELISHAAKSKPRILVVAPSNVAVDHIMERVIELGFKDGHGNTYRPSILRVGKRGQSHNNPSLPPPPPTPIDQVTLDTFLERDLHWMITVEQRRARLEELRIRIAHCIAEARSLLALLCNLRAGFDQCKPLPEGWELRVSLKTGLPYWADHVNRKTSTKPPIHEQQEQLLRGAKMGYQSLANLPEYEKHAHHFTQILSKIDHLHIEKSRVEAILGSQALSSSSKSGRNNPPSAAAKEQVELSIIHEAQILFTTLNSCGHPNLESTEFTVAVIDEAAQCTEPSLLIPLRRGCKKCVLVGDQDQLSATVFSTDAKLRGYDRSLFQRLIDTGHPYVLLDTQYRMRPEISRFPAATFYDGLLQDGSNVQKIDYNLPNLRPNRPLIPWFHASEEATDTQTMNPAINPAAADGVSYFPVFNSFMFFDLQYARDKSSSTSLSKVNVLEAVFCIQLIECLLLDYEFLRKTVEYNNTVKRWRMAAAISPATALESIASGRSSSDDYVLPPVGSIGVITPYAEQLQELKRRLRNSAVYRRVSRAHPLGAQLVEMNTVDGFQGREKDIVFISTVRANDDGVIGFLSNRQRMNVAITRAKYALFVVGHAETLRHHALWHSFLNHAESLQANISVPHPIDEMYRRERRNLKQIAPVKPVDSSHGIEEGEIPDAAPSLDDDSNKDKMEDHQRHHQQSHQHSDHSTKELRFFHEQLVACQRRMGFTDMPDNYKITETISGDHIPFSEWNATMSNHNSSSSGAISSLDNRYIQPPLEHQQQQQQQPPDRVTRFEHGNAMPLLELDTWHTNEFTNVPEQAFQLYQPHPTVPPFSLINGGIVLQGAMQTAISNPTAVNTYVDGRHRVNQPVPAENAQSQRQIVVKEEWNGQDTIGIPASNQRQIVVKEKPSSNNHRASVSNPNNSSNQRPIIVKEEPSAEPAPKRSRFTSSSRITSSSSSSSDAMASNSVRNEVVHGDGIDSSIVSSRGAISVPILESTAGGGQLPKDGNTVAAAHSDHPSLRFLKQQEEYLDKMSMVYYRPLSPTLLKHGVDQSSRPATRRHEEKVRRLASQTQNSGCHGSGSSKPVESAAVLSGRKRDVLGAFRGGDEEKEEGEAEEDDDENEVEQPAVPSTTVTTIAHSSLPQLGAQTEALATQPTRPQSPLSLSSETVTLEKGDMDDFDLDSD